MALGCWLDSGSGGSAFTVGYFSYDTFFSWISYDAEMRWCLETNNWAAVRRSHIHSDVLFWWNLLCLIWRWYRDGLRLPTRWWHAMWPGACYGIFWTNREGIMVDICGSKLRTPKITFLVVDARVEQNFRGRKIKLEKNVESKINGHIDRRYQWTPNNGIQTQWCVIFWWFFFQGAYLKFHSKFE